MSDQRYESLRRRLEHHGQEHVLRWWHELDQSGRRRLAEQLDAIDLDLVSRLCRNKNDGSAAGLRERIRSARSPADTVRQPKRSDDRKRWDQAIARGHEILAAGRVAAVVVAGGQATRLGYDHPKGLFPIGPVSGCSLYQILAEQVLARSRRAKARIPYYVMNSEATHDETVAFFSAHLWFGLPAEDVIFFQQGTMPAVDAATGRLLLEDKGRLATSPDGHGGMLEALAKAGLLDDMRSRGIDFLFYHQVDNPTARICDPAFLGFHAEHDAEVSTKVVAKRSPDEKMGAVVDVDGKSQIIEYSELTPDDARRSDESGRPIFWAGNTAIHIFNRDFLERLMEDDLSLPFHLAKKPVPYIDETGRLVTPETPNAFKFERFIFDALPRASRSLVVEADRSGEFNPVKQAEGDDSPATAQAAMVSLHRRWLEEAGVSIAEGVAVEISPLFALDADELKGKIAAGTSYTNATYLRTE